MSKDICMIDINCIWTCSFSTGPVDGSFLRWLTIKSFMLKENLTIVESFINMV